MIAHSIPVRGKAHDACYNLICINNKLALLGEPSTAFQHKQLKYLIILYNLQLAYLFCFGKALGGTERYLSYFSILVWVTSILVLIDIFI